jgi:hypothetical protein
MSASRAHPKRSIKDAESCARDERSRIDPDHPRHGPCSIQGTVMLVGAVPGSSVELPPISKSSEWPVFNPRTPKRARCAIELATLVHMRGEIMALAVSTSCVAAAALIEFF